MKIYFLVIILIMFSCKQVKKTENLESSFIPDKIKAKYYELIKANNQKGLLILFPCYPCNAKNTLKEFKITDVSIENGFSILAMDFNESLFLNNADKKYLEEKIIEVIEKENLINKNIFIGGFSSGGNVSLLISNYLQKNTDRIKLKGVFIIDSPVDLLGLYNTSIKNIDQNYSEASIQEATLIKSLLDTEFGNPKNGISNYEKFSPYTSKTQNIDNLKGLRNLKIRFYTEPDLEWWYKQAKNNYEDLNAFYIQELTNKLKMEFGNKDLELIIT